MTSKGYESASDGKAKPYEYINLAPAGSLASTGADMGSFMIAHLQNGAFGGAAHPARRNRAEDARAPAQTSVGPLNRMMLGFYETTANGHRAIAHGGDTQWFHSDLQLFLGRQHRHLRLDQQRRQGRQRAPDPRRPGHRLRQPLPAAAPAAEGDGVDAATAKQHAQHDRRHATTAAAAPIRTS